MCSRVRDCVVAKLRPDASEQLYRRDKKDGGGRLGRLGTAHRMLDWMIDKENASAGREIDAHLQRCVDVVCGIPVNLLKNL